MLTKPVPIFQFVSDERHAIRQLGNGACGGAIYGHTYPLGPKRVVDLARQLQSFRCDRYGLEGRCFPQSVQGKSSFGSDG
mgnify:CR=1 FL=1